MSDTLKHIEKLDYLINGILHDLEFLAAGADKISGDQMDRSQMMAFAGKSVSFFNDALEQIESSPVSRPDWENSPEWARYVAMDSNGEWTWFDRQPEWNSRFQIWQLGEQGKAIPAKNDIHAFSSLQRRPRQETLERRP